MAALDAVVVQRWRFLVICASAGALAVPLHAVATPVAALIALLLGFAGLRVWRWSHLPQAVEYSPQGGFVRSVRPVAWLGLGVAVGLVLLGVIRTAIEPVLPSIGLRIAAAGALPVWRRVLIIYVAAVSEELLFRLILFSAIAGLAARLLRLPDGRPTPSVAWVANLVSAFAFALIHLPSWSGVAHMSVGLGAAVMALNMVGGTVFGFVFATRGIVPAMWTHAGADCAIQLLGPLT